MRTFDQQTKTEVVALAQSHVDGDHLIKGTYGLQSVHDNKFFRGCSIGCLVGGQHERVEQWGIPEAVAYIADSIFEGLPPDDHIKWHVDWINAIPVNADLSLVPAKFVHWAIHDPTDGIVARTCPDIVPLINAFDFLLAKAAEGVPAHPSVVTDALTRAWRRADNPGATLGTTALVAAWQTLQPGQFDTAVRSNDVTTIVRQRLGKVVDPDYIATRQAATLIELLRAAPEKQPT